MSWKLQLVAEKKFFRGLQLFHRLQEVYKSIRFKDGIWQPGQPEVAA